MGFETNIKQKTLSVSAYNAVEKPKSQIYFHHTAGNANPYSVINGWEVAKNKVCTAFVIGGKEDKTLTYKDGDIIQCFSEKHWGYHLGLKQDHFTKQNLPFKELNETSIAIEICNWGYVDKKADGKFYTYMNTVLPESEVVKLDNPFRGHEYYHAYTDKQLDSLKKLLIYLCDKYSILKVYNEDIWDLTPRAYKGENGIFTHVSVRSDKFDCYPNNKLIEVLKNLNMTSL